MDETKHFNQNPHHPSVFHAISRTNPLLSAKNVGGYSFPSSPSSAYCASTKISKDNHQIPLKSLNHSGILYNGEKSTTKAKP